MTCSPPLRSVLALLLLTAGCSASRSESAWERVPTVDEMRARPPPPPPETVCAMRREPGACAGDKARGCLEEGLALEGTSEVAERCRALAAILSACQEGKLEEACQAQARLFTRPRHASGPQPAYTQKARELQIEGIGIYPCVVSAEGEVLACEVRRSLPFLDDAILASLYATRFTPATFAGKPVHLRYDFYVRMQLQPRWKPPPIPPRRFRWGL